MKRPKGGRPRRTIQKRDPRRVIRVLTEGKVTEPSYLAEWGHRNRHVRLDTKEYGMVPLDDGYASRVPAISPPAYPTPTAVRYRPGAGRIADEALPVLMRGFTITTECMHCRTQRR